MPQNSILLLNPFTRINDEFVGQSDIDASEIDIEIKHPLITHHHEQGDNHNIYKFIGIDISVETAFNYPYPYISEKSLRAFAYKRALIVVGACNTLSALKSKGFQTFDDFIDESYDQIKDPITRFKTVTAEIQRICCLPLNDIVQYLENNKAKLDHNFKNLKNLQETELSQIRQQIY